MLINVLNFADRTWSTDKPEWHFICDPDLLIDEILVDYLTLVRTSRMIKIIFD